MLVSHMQLHSSAGEGTVTPMQTALPSLRSMELGQRTESWGVQSAFSSDSESGDDRQQLRKVVAALN